MRSLLRRSTPTAATSCDCTLTLADGRATLEADDCDGDLGQAPDCREHLVMSIDQSVESIVVRRAGIEFHHPAPTVATLVTTARFVDRVREIDEHTAAAAARHPRSTATALAHRADTVASIARDVGFLDVAPLRASPAVGLVIGNALINPAGVVEATLRETHLLETNSIARIYETGARPCYALEPAGHRLPPAERRRLTVARDAIADGVAADAAEALAGSPTLVPILEKYTTGFGILEDCFADPAVSDVFITAPVGSNTLGVIRDGEAMASTVTLRERGARAIASRLRRSSGRAFSRASPTIDASVTMAGDRRLRVAGVAPPVSAGLSFAFREQSTDAFTLPRLIANGTCSPAVAALLSLAVERNVSALVAGTRGAGKTTLLGALLFELPPSVRTVVIEDTRELPVRTLQSLERDVEGLLTATGEGPDLTPEAALRTALRLGDGALVVGEIRGEEASVLYEAMRVGANANAVLGTIHGDGADDVFERVTADLGVPPSSFAVTDLVVTVQAARTDGGISRRLAGLEEVVVRDGECVFEPLFTLDDSGVATETGRIDRGESRLLESMARPTETYADVRDHLADRRSLLRNRARDGLVAPGERR